MPRARGTRKPANAVGGLLQALTQAVRQSNKQKPKKKKTEGQAKARRRHLFPLALPGDLRPDLTPQDYATIKQSIIVCMDHGAGLMRLNGNRVDFSADVAVNAKLIARLTAVSTPSST